MKTFKIILAVITILFAGLGFFRILPFDISNPIMNTALATLLLVRSLEYKNGRNNSGFLFTVIPAVFVYLVVIYVVFIG